MEQSTAYWIFGVLLTVISLLFTLWIASVKRWTMDRFAEINRLAELAHSRVNSANGHIQAVEDRVVSAEGKIIRHEEKHKNTDKTLEDIKDSISVLPEMAQNIAVISDRLSKDKPKQSTG